MRDPADTTRRRVLVGTTAAVATALAGCGSPGGGGDPGFENEGADGGTPPAGEAGENASGAGEGNGTGDDNDSETGGSEYAPQGNSTRASGNRTVSERTPDDDATDGGGNTSGAQNGTGAGGQNES